MEQCWYGEASGQSDGGAGQFEGSSALCVHLDLTGFDLTCPNCGAPLNLPYAGEVENGTADRQTLDGLTPTCIAPAVCPACGKPIIFG